MDDASPTRSTIIEDIRIAVSRIYAKIFQYQEGKADIMQSREPSHAGSWYSDNRSTLTRQLDQWLAQVPNEIEGIGSLPVPGSRVVIAPYVS
jgi:hypothetical protein